MSLRCGLHYPGKADQISESAANGDADSSARDAGLSLPLIKPNRSAVSQWRSSCGARTLNRVIRFIFMGNQPFSDNGEAMELGGLGGKHGP